MCVGVNVLKCAQVCIPSGVLIGICRCTCMQVTACTGVYTYLVCTHAQVCRYMCGCVLHCHEVSSSLSYNFWCWLFLGWKPRLRNVKHPLRPVHSCRPCEESPLWGATILANTHRKNPRAVQCALSPLSDSTRFRKGPFYFTVFYFTTETKTRGSRAQS